MSFLVKEGKVSKNFLRATDCHYHLYQVNVSVDKDLGLPVIVPVRQGAGGGAAEERKNQVSTQIVFFWFKEPVRDSSTLST